MADLDKLKLAALLRYRDGKTWEEVSEFLGVSDRTPYRWRESDDWQEAVEYAVKEMKRDGLGVAWRRLLLSAEQESGAPGVTAAKELLARLEGAVPQSVGLHGEPGKPPVSFAHLTAEEAIAILGNGGPYQHAGEAEPDNGSDAGTDAGD